VTTWIVVVVVVIVVILLAWGANAYRLARRNNNVGRRSPRTVGRGGSDVDEHNRSAAERRRTEG
jgi:uncharacterized membrane protein YqiK